MFDALPSEDSTVVLLRKARRRPSSVTPSRYRYRIAFRSSRGDGSSLQIVDRQTAETLIDWRGPVLVELARRHPVLEDCSVSRDLLCSKAFVRQLALSKTAIDLARARRAANGAVTSTSIRACGPDAALGRLSILLQSRPGIHYTLDDVCNLLALQGFCPASGQVLALLDELCQRGEMQRIVAAPERVFYDCDTTPHLHIYDPETNELSDAPATGVIRSAGGA